MAIHDNENQSSPIDAALSRNAAQNTAQPTPNTGFFQTQSVLSDERRLFGRSTSGESVSRYAEQIRKILAEKLGDNTSLVKMSVLDKEAKLTALSAIILSYKLGNGILVYHRLLVESSGTLPTQQLNFGPQSVEVIITAGDVDNRMFVEKCEDIVQAEWGGTKSSPKRIVDAGAQVIPSELDANDTAHIHDVLFHAFSSIESVADELGGEVKPFAIASHIQRSDILTAKVDFHPLPVETAGGLPIRSDIALVLTGTTNQNQDVLQNVSRNLARIDGFVDLLFAPPPAPAWGQPPIPQHYYPRFVMTQLSTLTNAVSLERQLFALATASLLNRDMLWASTFKPRIDNSGSVNLRDIGAIGLEIPALMGGQKGQRVPTQSAGFGTNELYELVSRSVHPGLIYSIDVEECGEMSWINLVFIAAASGDAAATRALYDACNSLTNGIFAECFRPDAPIVVDSGNRIHLGYYTDETGNKRDLREIDYLALLNIVGDKDMNPVYDWAATFENLSEPEPMRLERRLRIMQHINTSVTVKGYARRIDFSAEFITALDMAAQRAGLQIRGNISQGMVGQRQRGFANAAQLSLQPNVGGVFAYSSSPYAQGPRFAYPSNRWQSR